MRNNFGDETNDVESDANSIDSGKQHRSEPSALPAAPPASSCSGFLAQRLRLQGLVNRWWPFSHSQRPSGQVLRASVETDPKYPYARRVGILG